MFSLFCYRWTLLWPALFENHAAWHHHQSVSLSNISTVIGICVGSWCIHKTRIDTVTQQIKYSKKNFVKCKTYTQSGLDFMMTILANSLRHQGTWKSEKLFMTGVIFVYCKQWLTVARLMIVVHGFMTNALCAESPMCVEGPCITIHPPEIKTT